MHYIILAGIFSGAAILLFSMIQYYRALVVLRLQSSCEKTFSKRIYVVCMVMMAFFFIGYLVMGVNYLFQQAVTSRDLLLCSIFFFGSIFVNVVITVQTQMLTTIKEKSDELIRTLVNAIEAKDQYTRGHSVHVLNLVRIFYSYLPVKMQHKINLGQLLDAAILHDIGKIGISDNVLNKPGKLDDEEWVAIRSHPRMGKQILDQTNYSELSDMILMHHERVDQKGYYRVPVDQIPLESKIIAIADTFSALYSDRVYRPRKSYNEAMKIIQEGAGTQFDSELAAIFTQIPEADILEASRDLFKMEKPGSSLKIGLPVHGDTVC